jgi:hypothetical protein
MASASRMRDPMPEVQRPRAGDHSPRTTRTTRKWRARACRFRESAPISADKRFQSARWCLYHPWPSIPFAYFVYFAVTHSPSFAQKQPVPSASFAFVRLHSPSFAYFSRKGRRPCPSSCVKSATEDRMSIPKNIRGSRKFAAIRVSASAAFTAFSRAFPATSRDFPRFPATSRLEKPVFPRVP